jgi:hypothetical protein
LTPRQRMEKAMADLKYITGYDGSGIWTEGPKTVVDYTDTQGKKHHQELKVWFVHETQDPKSPVVYEVLEDPKTGEMMFTIRATSTDKDIKGLNDPQAALVRQAWAYLLSADPQVMQKFWRVNRTAGVAVGNFLQLSSNDLSLRLIKFNPERLKEFPQLTTMIGILLVESNELYAAQFGYHSPNWEYYDNNLPPDCLDKNAMADSWKRSLLALEAYKNNLPLEVYSTLKSMLDGSLKGVVQIPCKQ